MGLTRNLFLAASESQWLRERAPRYRFVRRAVRRFMPGETLTEALRAAQALKEKSISTIFTYLGENVAEASEAERVTRHYIETLGRIREAQLDAELSVKLTELGLDVDQELCYQNLVRIIESAREQRCVWIDMESSSYVDRTLDLYRRSQTSFPNVGVCLQAYLYRTENDLDSLLPLGAAIRLVKGAYKEPADRAFPQKQDVDENYFSLGLRLLRAKSAGVRAALGTHDQRLIQRFIDYAESQNLPRDRIEFQMLYGIQRAEQVRLAHEGWRSVVLISYGNYWFPWYMRRLAERPANAWFVARSLISR